jgi:cytochrome bd-type quinol oxidase subunit 2
MTYFGVLLGIIIMAVMINLAVNKKSNLHVRIASLAALALMILTIIICVFLIFTDNRVPVDESVLIVGVPVEVKEDKNNNFWVMILLIIFLIAVFSAIAYLAMKENKRQNQISPGGLQAPKRFSF